MALIIIFFTDLAIKLIYLPFFYYRHSTTGVVIGVVDGLAYLLKSLEIGAGNFMPIRTHGMGLSLLTAPIFKLLGSSSIFVNMVYAHFINIFISSLCIFPLYFIAKRIFSDKKAREGNDRFHTQPISEIRFKSSTRDEKIEFRHSKIVEVDSDHQQEAEYTQESHLIQFVDIVTGGISQVIDCSSKHEGKCLIADTLLKMGLPEKVMKINKNSRFYKIYSVSFFPKHYIPLDRFEEDSLEIQLCKSDQFYIKRPLVFKNRDQLTFNFILK